jgi:hypothetical protein
VALSAEPSSKVTSSWCLAGGASPPSCQRSTIALGEQQARVPDLDLDEAAMAGGRADRLAPQQRLVGGGVAGVPGELVGRRAGDDPVDASAARGSPS